MIRSNGVFLPLRDDAPRARVPWATLAIIVANGLVFLLQQSLPGPAATLLLYAGGAIPYEIAGFTDLVDSVHPPALLPPPLTILSSLFLHGGLEHLAGNLWFLWVFGDNVEGALGSWRFLGFYLACGCLAAVAQVVTGPESRIPIVGASGAIAAVLGAFASMFPRARVEVVLLVTVLVQAVVIPAFFLLGVWFVWQLMSSAGDGSVAVWAHVWGFLLGAVLCRLLARRSQAGPQPLPRPRRRPRPWTIARPAAASSSLPL